ncbi:alkyl sulfatase dimerization domain-containing protein [Lentibacillus sp. Marseille-P4043]|uniref:alkyl sulfatase dimerization domain-containing protein n=1 Tax=Lentibacillus sp. Marseille-P4043 TaxID=2040293 RepID=UPI000D0B4007|nr:alkyl sulfatase dimerization domain-containing protein [Lentibacillus sp. Marseille-P4043]
MNSNHKLRSIDKVMDQTSGNSKKEVKLIKLKEDHYFVKGFANVGVIFTSEGVVVIDTSVSKSHANDIYSKIREKTNLPIKYIIYTHGHLDHVHSTDVFKEPGTKVIGHENINERFLKYKKLEEYHLRINSLQFQNKLGLQSFEFCPPDVTFHNNYEFSLGGKDIQIVHGKGETDDHCFIYVKGDNIVYSGDFFIWSFPNIGNPLKVIRYEREWYETLEKIKELHPEILVPGHGSALKEKETIQTALQDVIDTLYFIHEEVILHINKGTPLEYMVESIQLPEHLRNSPYVQQTYGCLNFSIKGVYRRYTGWFDGNPTNLNPSKSKEIAAELLSLIQNDSVILTRCRELIEREEYQMAMHLLDILIVSKDIEEAKQLKNEAVKKYAEENDNFIMRNIYRQYQ